MSTVVLTAYNVKTKEKNVPIMDAVISKTAKGAYMAQGHDGKGNKLTTLLGEAKALEAIKAGVAKTELVIPTSNPGVKYSSNRNMEFSFNVLEKSLNFRIL